MPHIPIGGGLAANTCFGLGVGVKPGVLIRGGSWNRMDFQPAHRLAESPAGLFGRKIERCRINPRRADKAAETQVRFNTLSSNIPTADQNSGVCPKSSRYVLSQNVS